MRTFKKSTKKEIEEMTGLYSKRIPLNAIATKTGRDRSTIRYWVKKLNIKRGMKIKTPSLKQELKETRSLLERRQKEVDEAPFGRLKQLDVLIKDREDVPIMKELLERSWAKYDKLNEMITDLHYMVKFEK